MKITLLTVISLKSPFLPLVLKARPLYRNFGEGKEEACQSELPTNKIDPPIWERKPNKKFL
jgi:hypothetical protein